MNRILRTSSRLILQSKPILNGLNRQFLPVQTAWMHSTHVQLQETAKEPHAPNQVHEFGKFVLACMPKYVQRITTYKDELTIYCAPSAVEPLTIFLRDHTNAQFRQCIVCIPFLGVLG